MVNLVVLAIARVRLLDQEHQQRVGILAQVATYLALVVHRLLDPLVCPPVRLVFENLSTRRLGQPRKRHESTDRASACYRPNSLPPRWFSSRG